MLQGKKFLLCVSGGIAVYKALELVRFLKKLGGSVKVAMTSNAQKFVTPLSFEVLSENPVLTSESEDWVKGLSHIAYAQWADVCILAPATLNSYAKFAYGIADNAMLSTMVACSAPIVIAPAANTQMYLSLQSQKALQLLKHQGCQIIEPREDLLACGVQGIGALKEIEEIAYVAIREVFCDKFWSNQKVIVSGGGSSEKIDDVRCITNDSSGIQASYFALALFLFGANVVFVSSKSPIFLPSGIQRESVNTTQDFMSAIERHKNGASYYFGVAALSDFIPKESKRGKIKKQEGLEVEFIENLDILKTLEGIKKIGFKAEKDLQNAQMYAQKMLVEKNCDYVCLNILQEENHFGSAQNQITLLGQNGQKFEFAMQDKFSLACQILKTIASL